MEFCSVPTLGTSLPLLIFFDLFFLISPFRSLEMKLLGGVTLNHLSWAALAGGEGMV